MVVHGRFVGETHAGTLSGRVASTNGTTMQEFQFMKRGKEDEREVELATRGCGVYSACFTQDGREGENILSASVTVDYFQALHEPDASEPTKHSGKAKRREAMQKSEEAMRADAVSDVSAKVSGLNNWVQQMREELNYLTARTARHKQTVESNARRTVRTTFIEVCVLIAVTCVQIVTVKRFFDVQTRSHDQHRARAGAFSADVFGRAALPGSRPIQLWPLLLCKATLKLMKHYGVLDRIGSHTVPMVPWLTGWPRENLGLDNAHGALHDRLLHALTDAKAPARVPHKAKNALPTVFLRDRWMPEHPPPRIIALCGPAGVGKQALVDRLCEEYPERFGYGLATTTRPPHAHEVDGTHFHFVPTLGGRARDEEDGARRRASDEND